MAEEGVPTAVRSAGAGVSDLPPGSGDAKRLSAKRSKIDAALDRFRLRVADAAAARTVARGPKAGDRTGLALDDLAQPKMAKINRDGEIQIYAIVGEVSDEGLAELRSHGLRIELVVEELNTIQGWAAYDRIEQLADLEFVIRLKLPGYARRNTGSVESEGDALLNADDVRALPFPGPYRGTGIRVGVISDGADTRASAIASGDLPAAGVTMHPSIRGSGDEGTAMMEIVHDLAPGATLYFGGPDTDLEMVSLINWMAVNCHVICDDLAFSSQRFFEDDPIATAARNAVQSSGRVYCTAAGNDAQSHYQGVFDNSAGDNLHDFQPGGGIQQSLRFTIAGGTTAHFFLQWDDRWGASGNDYDLFIRNTGGVIIASSELPQDGADDPLEMASYANTSGVEMEVLVAVERHSGVGRTLELLAWYADAADSNATTADSIYGHRTVPGVITCAAIDAADPGVDTVEDYSSRGPSTIAYPSAETRQTPFIAGIDGVRVTGAGGFSDPFYGTSAAAPHLAAVCALLLDKEPTATPSQIRDALTAGARDLGASGFDNAYGYGRADALASINSLDVTDLTVTIDQAAAQADPTSSAPIHFTVLFSEPVSDFATGDVTIEGSAPGSKTAVVTGSGTTYDVAVSGMTGSGTVVARIASGVAHSASGTPNTASTSLDNTVTYDVVPLTVTIDQAAAQADPTSGSPILFTVVFSEPVSDFATGDVTIEGSAPGSKTAVVTGSGTTYGVAVSGMTGSGTVIARLAGGVAHDASGNPNAASTSLDNTVTYDIMFPSATIEQAVTQADPTSGSPVHFTVVFGEPVTDFATGDVTIEGTAPGSMMAVVTGGGTTYDVAVSGMTGSGTVIARVAAGVAQDASGNPNTASTSLDNTVTYDAVSPTVTITQAATQADPASSSPIRFTVSFSEPVGDFTTGDVTIEGSAPGNKTAIVTGGGVTYDVAVSGMTGSGTVIARIAAGVAHDASGNPNAESVSVDNTVTYDTTPLTVTIDQAAGQADPTSSSPIRFTVLFSEPVADFGAGDVTIEGSAPGSVTAVVTGGGTTYDVAVSGMTGSGTVTARIAAGVAHDASGTPNTASTSLDNTVTFDTTPLTVTIEQAAAQADPTSSSPIRFTVLFSEAVTDFGTGDVTIGGGAPGNKAAVVTGSGTTYDVAVSGMTGGGTVIAGIAVGVAHDALGTPNMASTSLDDTVTYDATPLTVTIEQAATQADPTSAAPILFTVLFNEPVTDFGTGDVTIEGSAPGSLTAVVTGSGTTYDVAVSGMTGSGTVIARLAAGVAHDAAGNPNTASTSLDDTVTYDITPLTVTVEQAASQADPTSGSPIHFTVLFNEPVADFATGDVTLEGTAPGGLIAVVTGAGTTYDVAVSGMTGSGTVIARVAAGVAHDASGTANAASASLDNTVTYDIQSPTVTIEQAAAQADPTSSSPIRFRVLFSEPVADFATGDVTIEGTAPGSKTAVVTGSGTTYDVAVSGMTDSGTVIARVAAGVAQDASGNPNTVSTSLDNTVTYDVTPLAVAIEQAALQADPTGASPIHFTVLFSEPVTDFAAGDVTIEGTAPGSKTAVVTGSGTIYDVAVSGMTDSGTVIARLAAGVAHDAAGNPNTASTSFDNTVTYDVTLPAVTIEQAAGQADPTGASPVHFTVLFNEPVADFATGDVTIEGTAPGSKTAVVTGSGTTYDVAVSGMTGSGTVIARIAAGVAHDTLGTPNPASTSLDNTVTYDMTPPTVTVEQAALQSDPTGVSPIRFTVLFSEDVADFGTGDVTIEGSAPGNKRAVVTGSGMAYDVAVSGMTGSGTVIVRIAAGVAHDASGNPNTASTSLDNTVIYDVTPLTVTVEQAAGQADPTTVSPIRFTVRFSEAVTNFATGDMTIEGTAPGGLIAVVTGSGTTYDVAVSGMTGSGMVIARVAADVANDVLGTPNTASTSLDNTVTYDATPLTVTVEQAFGQVDPTTVSPIHFTVLFSEPVTDFRTGDMTIEGSAPGNKRAVITGSGTTYDVAVSGMTGSGTVIARITEGVAHDASGTPNTASTSLDNTVVYDVTPLTVSIEQAAGQADPTTVFPVRFTVLFSEDVTDFGTGDVTIEGTAPGNKTVFISGNGTTYDVAVSGMTGSGTVIARIAAGVAHDVLGTPNAASTSLDNTVTYDTTPLTVSIEQAAGQADPTGVSPIRFTVEFSEDVADFGTGDVTIEGTAPGSMTAVVTGSGTTYDVAVSGMTGSGTVIARIAAGVAHDVLGSPNMASTSADNTVTYDGVAPSIVSITSTTADGVYGPGADINILLTFSEAVSLVGGDLVVTLETGVTDRDVMIGPFALTNTVSGVYTVQAGDASPDLSVRSIALSGGSVRDWADLDANLGVPAGQNLHDNKDIVVKTAYTIIAGATGNGTITPSGTVLVRHGGSTNFLMEAGPENHISAIRVNGGHIAGSPYSDIAFVSTNYVWNSIGADGDIMVTFAPNTYRVLGTAGSGTGSFDKPRGVAVDQRGFLYVADSGHHRIQRMDLGTGNWVAWGSYGTGAGQFNQPLGLAVDAAGDLFVADGNNHRVQRRGAAGAWTVWGGYGTGVGQFWGPFDVAADGLGNLYVADHYNNRVQKRLPGGQWAVFVSSGFDNGYVRRPNAVAVDSANNVLVMDYIPTVSNGLARLQKFDPGGRLLEVIVASGESEGTLRLSLDVGLGSGGQLLVADTGADRIRVNSLATWHTLLGPQTVSGPEGLVYDPMGGRLYIADTGNDRVLMAFLSTVEDFSAEYTLERDGFRLSWPGEYLRSYKVQYKRSLLDRSAWQPLPGVPSPLVGFNGVMTCTDTNGVPQRFYRILVE